LLRSSFPHRNKPWYPLHIFAVLTAENFQKPPFLNKHTEHKIKIRKHRDCKTVEGYMRIEGKNHEPGAIQGMTDDPIDAIRDQFFLCLSFDIPRDLMAGNIPPDLFKTHEFPGIQVFECKRSESETCDLDAVHEPAQPEGSHPKLPILQPMDKEEGYERGYETDGIVEGAVKDPHEGISEKDPACMLELLSDRYAVDHGEDEKNEDDRNHNREDAMVMELE
jgi:hypothetical protein